MLSLCSHSTVNIRRSGLVLWRSDASPHNIILLVLFLGGNQNKVSQLLLVL